MPLISLWSWLAAVALKVISWLVKAKGLIPFTAILWANALWIYIGRPLLTGLWRRGIFWFLGGAIGAGSWAIGLLPWLVGQIVDLGHYLSLMAFDATLQWMISAGQDLGADVDMPDPDQLLARLEDNWLVVADALGIWRALGLIFAVLVMKWLWRLVVAVLPLLGRIRMGIAGMPVIRP